MFCYQRNHYSQVEVIDNLSRFLEIISSSQLKQMVAACRAALHDGNDERYVQLKRLLPMFIFQAASVDLSDNKKGERGYWRTQAAVHLNGLCVLDVDHIDDPKGEWDRIKREIKTAKDEIPCVNGDFKVDDKWSILAVYVTPSGHGLKIVFTADEATGNLADNQKALSERLGLLSDASIKDSSRASFAVGEDDFLFIESALPFYINHDYETKFGETYRKGDSRPTRPVQESEEKKGPAPVQDRQDDEGQETVNEEELLYGTIPVATISERYTRKYGAPVKGDRHRMLIKVAGHFRYLVDNNPRKLKVALRTLPWVREWEQRENNAGEIDDVARDVCSYRMWRELPKALVPLLRDTDKDEAARRDPVPESLGESIVQSDSRKIWSRLQPLLADDPLYSLCTAHLPEDNKIAGVFVAGGMFCTLATRTHYLHYDGQQHRMNPQVFVIGKPASGKSFADELDKAVMSVLRAADEPGRKAELEYKKESKKRRTSNKAGKGEQQLQEPEMCIRYIPSRTSNAVFYRRQINAKELVGQDIMPLHLYTFDSELDASVAAQSGGSWIGKHDLELKAFHNEFSGVDYANADSVNEVIQVFWNQVVTGTDVSLAKKINMRNVNDGLCSRIAICRINSDEYTMISRGDASRHAAQMQALMQWGVEFDRLKGEIFVPKLVEHCYALCEKAARSAAVKQDRVVDYFRKRAVFYAEWFTIVRVLARAIQQRAQEEAKGDKGKPVDIMKPQVKQSDLEFAELIFDTVIYYQDVFFGSMLEEVWQNAQNTFVVRKQTRTTRNEELFTILPDVFTRQMVMELLKTSYGAANSQLHRWIHNGLIKKISKTQWKKC